MGMLRDDKPGTSLIAEINKLSKKLATLEPVSDEYIIVSAELQKLYKLSVEDEVKEIQTSEQTLAREDSTRDRERQAELRELELEEKRLSRESDEKLKMRELELRELELKEKEETRKSDERDRERQAELKERELEEKRLSREAEERGRKVQERNTLIQIGLGTGVAILGTVVTAVLMDKAGNLETNSCWTSYTGKQIISSIAKNLKIGGR